MTSSPPCLFLDRGCPFAHRVLALLDHLGVEPELREVDPGRPPPELLAISPSCRVPLLQRDGLVLGESRVMLEHLAELYRFGDAYPADITSRARHREAMALMDQVLTPRALAEDAAPVDLRLAECLDVLSRATDEPASPSLLAFHLAPLWLRFRWWRPDGAVTRAVCARPALAAWLDAATHLPSVARHAPDRAANTATFQRRQALEQR